MFVSNSATTQTATNPPAGGAGDALLSSPVLILLPMFVLFYFLILRPQQKRVKEHQNRVSVLKKGDNVVLSSGILGKVTKVDEDEAHVDIAQGVIVRVVKSMISDVRSTHDATKKDSKP